MNQFQAAAGAELELRKRKRTLTPKQPDAPEGGEVKLHQQVGWEAWLKTLFASYFSKELADHHREFWEWVWRIRSGEHSRPFVGVWPRGGGKSTNAEAAVVAVGATGARRYVLYVRATQDAADASVANIASLLERAEVEEYYPLLAQRSVGKYGSSRGWRRNRLRTASGFTVDGIGLDVAKRGAKVDEARPDLIIFDDIDDLFDTLEQTEKKLSTIAKSILPAGSDDFDVLVVQNLILEHGIVSRLAGVSAEPCDILSDRIVSGPHPAVSGLEVSSDIDPETGRVYYRIIAGEPTWIGQGLEVCETDINRFGLNAFLSEKQHDLGDKLTALWSRRIIDRNRITPGKLPPLQNIVVAVDPPRSSGQCGIVVVGLALLGGQKHFYTLEDASPPRGSKPHIWGRAALEAMARWQADTLVAEVNQGGEMVENVIRNIHPTDEDPETPDGRKVLYKSVNAARGKRTRAEPIAVQAEEGRDHHVGTFVDLENQMCRWIPTDPNSPDRMDAKVWGNTYLDGLPSPRPKPKPFDPSLLMDESATRANPFRI